MEHHRPMSRVIKMLTPGSARRPPAPSGDVLAESGGNSDVGDVLERTDCQEDNVCFIVRYRVDHQL
jgi:hypothetical protein